jgi:hypothetical protein
LKKKDKVGRLIPNHLGRILLLYPEWARNSSSDVGAPGPLHLQGLGIWCYHCRAAATSTIFSPCYQFNLSIKDKTQKWQEKTTQEKPFRGPNVATPKHRTGRCLLADLKSELMRPIGEGDQELEKRLVQEELI